MDSKEEDEERSPLLKNSAVRSIHQTLPGQDVSNYSSVNTDNSTDVTSLQKVQVYRRRWYVLLVFSFSGAVQNIIWNTWGPISDSSKEAFGWTNADIALLSNWGPISYIVSGIFFSWVIDIKGLRIACTTSAFVIAAGAGFRCITSTPPWSTWLIHIGQFLNGLGGPVAMSCPPVISSIWFPPRERTTATSIAVLIPSVLGLAGSFLIGPLLVPPYSNTTSSHNHSHLDMYEDSTWLEELYVSDNTTSRVAHERKNIMFLMYLEFGISVIIFLIMLIYFPKKPPLPPCLSASIKREDFWAGLKKLFRCKQFWLVAMAYGASIGVCNVWTSVISVILKPLGVSQDESAWIGFYACCGACVASLVVARFADMFSKILKIVVLAMYAFGTVFTIVFALICIKVIPMSDVLLYVSIIIANSTLNGAVPLLYEMACELSYPIGEGTTNGVMTLLNNFGGLIFLFILMIPNLDPTWMNWLLVGTSIICFPLYGMLQERYNRLDIDQHTAEVSVVSVVPNPVK